MDDYSIYVLYANRATPAAIIKQPFFSLKQANVPQSSTPTLTWDVHLIPGTFIQ